MATKIHCDICGQEMGTHSCGISKEIEIVLTDNLNRHLTLQGTIHFEIPESFDVCQNCVIKETETFLKNYGGRPL